MPIRFTFAPMYSHFVNLLFPNVCCGCSQPLVKGEEHICAMCISELPRTGYIAWHENPVAKRLWGRVNLIHASSFMHFVKDSMVQQLLHNLKYKGQKEILPHIFSFIKNFLDLPHKWPNPLNMTLIAKIAN